MVLSFFQDCSALIALKRISSVDLAEPEHSEYKWGTHGAGGYLYQLREYYNSIYVHLDRLTPRTLEIYKQNTDSSHEYATVTFYDGEGRPAYLRLEGDIELPAMDSDDYTTTPYPYSYPNPSSASLEQPCAPLPPDYLRRGLRLCSQATVTWSKTPRRRRGDKKLLLCDLSMTHRSAPVYDFVAMASVISKLVTRHQIWNHSCFFFTSMLLRLTENVFGVEFEEVSPRSADGKGHWHGVAVTDNQTIARYVPELLRDYSHLLENFEEVVRHRRRADVKRQQDKEKVLRFRGEIERIRQEVEEMIQKREKLIKDGVEINASRLAQGPGTGPTLQQFKDDLDIVLADLARISIGLELV
ncbi:hypothetical protein DXG01_011770 [Tephrocybe rancida]|nr:hypothetical protein DXG01_011770 [Tephrocybe rancida]